MSRQVELSLLHDSERKRAGLALREIEGIIQSHPSIASTASHPVHTQSSSSVSTYSSTSTTSMERVRKTATEIRFQRALGQLSLLMMTSSFADDGGEPGTLCTARGPRR
jgi:hypothetical protein